MAAWNGHIEIVKFLVTAGADVNHANKQYGYTALTSSTRLGHIEIVKCLVTAGADVNHAEKTLLH